MKTKNEKKTKVCNYVNKVILKGVIASALSLVTIFSCNLTINAETAKTFEGGNKHETRYEHTFKIELSDWQYYLYENPEAKMIYDTFSMIVDEKGNRVYSDEFIVGLLANVEQEGTQGLVEYSFSKCHQYDFCLPSNGSKIQTASDVEYLLNWTISDEDTKAGCAKKGSCGVSSLQWSYGRRIEWLTILDNKLKEEGRFVCNEEDLYFTNKEMFLKELDPNQSGGYYNAIENAVKDTNKTPEDYAEAICDYYVKPCGADLCMNGSGSACKERKEMATYIWGIFTSKDVKTYSISF